MRGRPHVDREGRRVPARPDRTAPVDVVSGTTSDTRPRRAGPAPLRAGCTAAQRRSPAARGRVRQATEREGRTSRGARPGERPSGSVRAGHPGTADPAEGARERPTGYRRRPGPARRRARPPRHRARRTAAGPPGVAGRAGPRGAGRSRADDRRLPAAAARRAAVRPRVDDVQPVRGSRAARLRERAPVRARGRRRGAAGAARSGRCRPAPCTPACGSRRSPRRR